MKLQGDGQVTIEQFYQLREETTQILEYLDGYVYMSPSPSTQHQRVSGRLHAKLFNYLEGSGCEVFAAPFDIQLFKEGIRETKILCPDLTIICDSNGLKADRFKGVPTLVVEILSPTNQRHDLVTKMDAYMKFGVKEYWVFNPMIEAVQVYRLNQEGYYEQAEALKKEGTLTTPLFPNLKIDIKDIFQRL